MTEAQNKSIVCFGEILWDSLPAGLFPGGAPMNVAYHLKQLGAEPIPITSVGNDLLGEELSRRLRLWGVDTSGVSVIANKPTGIARVTVLGGSPHFEIVEDVAWDWIELSAEGLGRALRGDALVFGSLAQRTENNRHQLATLLEVCRPALKVFDVNLRPPYASVEQVWTLAERADLIKLNDQELADLLKESVPAVDFAESVRCFAKRTRATKICLTAGAKGAGLLMDGSWYWESAREIAVRDTVGAGDAFLAALLSGLLQAGQSPEVSLRRACRLAEFVASCDGATPAYTATILGEFNSGKEVK